MDVYELLDTLHIEYVLLQHKAVYTIEEAMQENIPGRIEGLECKNLFLKSKDRYYLYVLPGDEKADLKKLAAYLQEKRISFASAEELMECLKLDRGSVTPLGIINDTDNKVTLVLDKTLIDKRLLVHPNTNTATISIEYADLLRYAQATGHDSLIF